MVERFSDVKVAHLYRPVGLAELEFMARLGCDDFRHGFRNSRSSIRCSTSSTRQIALNWNTKDSAGRAIEAGFVTEFDLPAEYVERFEEHTVGSSLHKELWVPAEELEEFNSQILGRIRVTEAFYGATIKAPGFDLDVLNSGD